MKFWCKVFLALVLFGSAAGTASAVEGYPERDETVMNHALHKLGRGVTNIFTFWVEWPHHIAIEWERTDPITGLFLGTAKGVPWSVARLAAGLYDTFTFPLPYPDGYEPLLYPEFIVTDTWGNEIPDLNDLHSNDPMYDEEIETYPSQFRF